jgi:hypothetical protein
VPRPPSWRPPGRQAGVLPRWLSWSWPRSAWRCFGRRRGRSRLPRIGGTARISGVSWVTSSRSPPVSVAPGDAGERDAARNPPTAALTVIAARAPTPDARHGRTTPDPIQPPDWLFPLRVRGRPGFEQGAGPGGLPGARARREGLLAARGCRVRRGAGGPAVEVPCEGGCRVRSVHSWVWPSRPPVRERGRPGGRPRGCMPPSCAGGMRDWWPSCTTGCQRARPRSDRAFWINGLDGGRGVCAAGEPAL